jgi:hypothetical protein
LDISNGTIFYAVRVIFLLHLIIIFFFVFIIVVASQLILIVMHFCICNCSFNISFHISPEKSHNKCLLSSVHKSTVNTGCLYIKNSIQVRHIVSIQFFMLTNYKKSGFGFLRRLITTLLIQFNFIAKPTNQPFSLATSNSCFICARSSGLTRTSHIESAIIFAAYTIALCAASLFPALR